MEEENQLMEQQLIETVNVEEKLENRESEGGKVMFTIRIMPGTTMHINIEAQDRHLPQGGTWCISTLLIHNGQHYASTIHNYMVNSELLQQLTEIHHDETSVASAVNAVNLLPHLLMPLPLPRNLGTSDNRFLANPSGPSNVRRSSLINTYNSYMRSITGFMGRVFGSMFENARDMPSLLGYMTGRFESSLRILTYAEEQLEKLEANEPIDLNDFEFDDETDDEKDDTTDENDDTNDENNYDDHENLLSDSDEDTQATIETESDGIECNCNNEDSSLSVSPSASETCGCGHHDHHHHDHHHHPQHQHIYLDAPNDFEERWSMTSSEEGNEDPLDESWESDFEDNEAFESYMLRHVRAHASGLISRLNAEWVTAQNQHTPPSAPNGGIDWDLGSCNSLGEIDDTWSEISDSSVDLDAWQYTEDRSFETVLSRPFRRLIGELPPQTAQQERQNSHFAEICDVHSEPSIPASFEPFGGSPLTFGVQWHPQENLFTASNNIRSAANTNNIRSAANTNNIRSAGNTNTNNLQRSNIRIDRHNLPLGSILNDSFENDLAQMRQNLNLLDWEMEPDLESDTESEEDNTDQESSDEAVEVFDEPVEEVIPMAAYLQQTDELIAQIKERLLSN